MNPVLYYKFEIDQIHHSSIKDLVIRIMNEKFPSYYMNVEASSTNRHHQIVEGEPIKLCEHVKIAARLFLLLKKNPLFFKKFTNIQLDYMLAAILLHDGTKRGLESEPTTYSVFEHPITAVNLMPDKLNSVELKHFSQIIKLITTHHGAWRYSRFSAITLPEVSDIMQYYVHFCDYLASRSVLLLDISDRREIQRQYVS